MIRRLTHSLTSPLRCRRGQRGESLTEVLVSMAIGALALLMLAMAISVATRIVLDSHDSMTTYYEAGNEIATGESLTSLGSGAVLLSKNSTQLELVSSGNPNAAWLQVDYLSPDKEGFSDIIVYRGVSE